MDNKELDIKVTETNDTEVNTIEDKRIKYDFSNTKDRLKDVMGIYEDDAASLAAYLGLSYQSLNKKLNGHVDFKREEIKAIADRYHLSAEMIYYIFLSE